MILERSSGEEPAVCALQKPSAQYPLPGLFNEPVKTFHTRPAESSPVPAQGRPWLLLRDSAIFHRCDVRDDESVLFLLGGLVFPRNSGHQDKGIIGVQEEDGERDETEVHAGIQA